MRKAMVGLLSLTLASGVGVALGSPAAYASPDVGQGAAATSRKAAPTKAEHDLPNPKEAKRRALREQALDMVLSGRAKAERRGPSTVVKVGEVPAAPRAVQAPGARSSSSAEQDRHRRKRVDQYVELSRETTDRIFVVLAEFGNERHPDYPDKDTDADTPGPTRFDGPLHNQIPEPDRRVDNSTVWQADYSAGHYRSLYFGTGAGVESLKTYYERQSSGRYSVDGQVTDWVKVRYNEARYGRSSDTKDTDPNVCAGVVCSNTWNLVQDAVNQWTADQKAKGRTTAQIRAELATFDKWDRYDADGDANFNERDGYIDHFQVVHAGGDEADGDPYQGEDAIWSHRWYVQTTPIGQGGPTGVPFGGTQIGDTGVWVGDYTIQPENGGLSVFAHEYGHDLGLPDLYDTAGGENGVNWWSLMAQSRLSAKGEPLGTRAGDLGAWEKLQLGWLDYRVRAAGEKTTLNLGPHEYNSHRPQALIVQLPPKRVTTVLATPFEGTRSWWSGKGDDLNNSMSRRLTLPAGPAELTFQANYDIEDCGTDPCDYAYVEVDDGTGYKAIPGSITKPGEGNGIDGTTNGAWVPARFDLSAYAGKEIGLRVRYATDGAVQGRGLFVDAIKVTAGDTTILEDGAESGANGWTLVGFSAVGATRTEQFANYHIASHRTYISYDRYLRTGPYNFGFANTRPNFVEHFPYQRGLLINYWDLSQSDNNTSEHPGEGLILPVDANPEPLLRADGQPWRNRIQGYDATFSNRRSDSFTLHLNGLPNRVVGRPAQPVFDDRRSYWSPVIPAHSVKVPQAGVRLRVVSTNGTSMKVRLTSTR